MVNKKTIPQTCSVAVVGGGTAGLSLAAELKRQGVDSVVVLERESDAGGIPRHCGHYPFGVHEYNRLMKGPDYARKNVETAINLGVEIYTDATVTALHPNGRLSLSTPSGLIDIQAERVVLCTGVRESSRAQRFIGGDRPLGVLTTGALQTMVYLQGMRPFERPVILGSELVSFSAIDTCRHLGIQPVAMVEEQDRIIGRKILRPYLFFRNVPLHVSARSLKVIGRERVEAIEFHNPEGKMCRINTDGIIISGHFRPEAALLQQSHLEVDVGSGGPVIDQFGQCSDPAYYSAGNLLRPAETSGWCWQEGIDTARRIARDISGPKYEVQRSIRLCTTDPSIGFVVPQRLTISERPDAMSRMQIGLNRPIKGQLEALAAGNRIWKVPINSRPVRRILMPLTGILNSRPNSDVELFTHREP